MTIGEAVKAVREKAGRSQQEFSNDLRVTVTTVSRWERDKFTPDADKLAALADVARLEGMTDVAAVLTAECGSVFGRILEPGLTEVLELNELNQSDLCSATRDGTPMDEIQRKLSEVIDRAMRIENTLIELLVLARASNREG